MKNSRKYFMLFSFLIVFLFLFLPFCFAGTFSTVYGGAGYDGAVAVKELRDGNYLMAGETASFGSNSQVWVVKVNPSGGIIWQRRYQEPEKENYSVKAMDLAPNGGYVLAGEAQTCYEEDGVMCQGYGWLARFDADGRILWQKGYKDTGGYASTFHSVQCTADGGFIAVGAGATLGAVTPRSKLWVVKVDSTGNILWQWMVDHANVSDSYANSVQQTQDGGYIVAGAVDYCCVEPYTWHDIWAIKFSGAGSIEWHNMYRSPEVYDIGWSVRQAADGGYVIGGQTQDSAGYGMDGLVLKLDANGAIEWQKNYESGEGDSIKIIQLTPDGGYIVGGLYQLGGVALTLQTDGTVEWGKRYGNSSSIVSLDPTSDGFVMATVGSAIRDATKSADFLLLKTDEAGQMANCPSAVNAEVQVYDAFLTAQTFAVTAAESPELRIIDTLAFAADTDASPIEQCPYKILHLLLSCSEGVSASSYPEGMQCVGNSCSGQFQGGSEAAITLYPGSEVSLMGWGGDCSSCGSAESCSIRMDKDKSCTAIFATPKGDISGDGGVDLADAILALQVNAGMHPSLGIGYSLSGADVNGDRQIGLAEAIYVLQCVARLRNNHFPVLTRLENQTVNEGEILSFTLQATDEDGDPLTYTAEGLPAGAEVDSASGVFTWNPTYSQNGVYPVTFRVQDDYGGSDSFSISITAQNANRSPVLHSIGDRTVKEGLLLSFTVSATDDDGDDLTYGFSVLPDGALFDGATGVFSWTPGLGQQGVYLVTFSVSDGMGGTDSEAIAITVSPFTISSTDYFPLNIGDWVDWQSSTGTIGRTTVTGPFSIGGASVMALNYASGEIEYYTSDSNGVKLYGTYLNEPPNYTGNVILDAPLLLFPNNVQLGQRQSSSSLTLNNVYVPEYGKYVVAHVDIISTTNILGLENIQAANTTLKDCVKISVVLDMRIKDIVVDGSSVEVNEYISGDPVFYWLYKGVGCVKEISDGETSLITQSSINGVQRTY